MQGLIKFEPDVSYSKNLQGFADQHFIVKKIKQRIPFAKEMQQKEHAGQMSGTIDTLSGQGYDSIL